MNKWAAVFFMQDNWRHGAQWQYYSVRLWADAEELCQIQVEGERADHTHTQGLSKTKNKLHIRICTNKQTTWLINKHTNSLPDWPINNQTYFILYHE